MLNSARLASTLFVAALLAYPLWTATGAALREDGPSYPGARFGVATPQQVDSVRDAFARHLVLRELRLRSTPLLSNSEKHQLRRAPYDTHRHLSKSHGVKRQPRKAKHAIPDGLKSLPTETPYYVQHDGTGMLAPGAIAALDVIGARFHRLLAAEGLPLVRFSISSAYRSAYNQSRLRRRNRNATRGVSSHEFGGSFDITYKRFAAPVGFGESATFKVGDELPILSAAELKKETAIEEAKWEERMASRYTSRFAALLGRALIELEDEGRLVALREVRQPCYHVTVGKTAPRA